MTNDGNSQFRILVETDDPNNPGSVISDQITLINQTSFPGYVSKDKGVETIEFSDGTVIDLTGGLTFEGTSASDVVRGTDLNDVLLGLEGNDNLSGFDGDDTLLGGEGNDNLDGGEGNDALSGQGGNDTVNGGAGDDIFAYFGIDDLNDQFNGGVDNDTILNVSGADMVLPLLPTIWTNYEVIDGGGRAILADASDNALDFSSLSLVNYTFISGEDGQDSITGTTGNDTIIGGDGNDTLLGGDGNDVMAGQAGVDSLVGGAGDDIFAYLDSSDLSDTYEGGAGNDTVWNVSGADLILPSLPTSWTDIEVIDGGGQAIVGDGGGNSLDFSALTTLNTLFIGGGDGNDSVIGTMLDDTILGGAGTDTLIGGDGNDIFAGEAGIDLIEGGMGDDILAYFGISDLDDTFDGGSGVDTILNVTGTDFTLPTIPASWTDVEVIDGAGNALLGDNADNTLDFSALILTNVLGVSGQEGADTIIGSSGDDVFTGAQGQDTLTGGAGDDVFVMAVGFGREEITDFVAGTATEDKLNVALMGENFDTFAEVMGAATDVDGNAEIDFGGGDVFVLNGIASTSLTNDDFEFTL